MISYFPLFVQNDVNQIYLIVDRKQSLPAG